MASTSEYETTTGYETTTEYTKATTTPAATAASGAGGGAGVAASVAATHFDRPDTPPEEDAGAALKPMRGTFADNGKDLNLRALARKTFSLQDRATIVALADKQAAGEHVEHLLWTDLRNILSNNPVRNLPKLAQLVKTNASKRAWGGFPRQSVNLIEDVINRDITLDEAIPLAITAPIIDPQVLHLLLSRGASTTMNIMYGMQPLHVACVRRTVAAVELLIEFGAPIDQQCNAGYTPLHYACLANAEACAVLLRRVGANVEIRNRAGHQPLQTGTGVGWEELDLKLQRALGVREEALMRAKRFYINIMEGHEGYVGAEADRDPLFDNGRMMAAIVLRKPRFFTGSREKKRLVPADLEDMERLGKKVWGKHWQYHTEKKFKYTHKKYWKAIGAVIFDGKLSKDEVGAQLEGSFARRRARLEKERREAVKREWEDSYTDFVKWARNPDPVHQRYMLQNIAALCDGRSPICRLNIDKLLDRKRPLPSIYQHEALNWEEKGVMEALRASYEDRAGHLFEDYVEEEEEEEEEDFGPGAAALAAMAAIAEHDEQAKSEIESILSGTSAGTGSTSGTTATGTTATTTVATKSVR